MLVGGLGGDTLFGNLGADTFRYLGFTDSSNSHGGFGADVIGDFQRGVDKLDLSAVLRGAPAGALIIESYSGWTFVDVYNPGVGHLVVQLVGSNAVAMSDIISG